MIQSLNRDDSFYNADEGTISEDIPEDLRKESCLSTEDSIRLGNLGIKVFNLFVHYCKLYQLSLAFNIDLNFNLMFRYRLKNIIDLKETLSGD